jgi:hypothetical protein
VFQRVSVEEAGLVPAVLDWVQFESQLAFAQRRYSALKKWADDRAYQRAVEIAGMGASAVAGD